VTAVTTLIAAVSVDGSSTSCVVSSSELVSDSARTIIGETLARDALSTSAGESLCKSSSHTHRRQQPCTPAFVFGTPAQYGHK
jgi:hypothetical protein